MGTNYYYETKPLTTHTCADCGAPLRCDTCETEYRIHIGKSSAGWVFSFHGTETIRSYADWLQEFAKGGRIVDEYGDEMSVEDFRNLVAAKRMLRPNGQPPLNSFVEGAKEDTNIARSIQQSCWVDPEGHPFCSREFS